MTTHAQGKQQKKASGDLQIIQKDMKSLVAFWTKFNNDWSWNNAAGLAYNLILAIFPIVIALVSILGFFIGALDAHAYNQLRDQLIHTSSSLAGARDIINAALNQLKNNAGFLAIIAIVFALFNGSRLFLFMEGALDIIYHVRPRGIIGQNVMAFVMLLIFVLLVPIMLLASAGPALVFSILQKTPLAAIPGIQLLFSLGGILGGLLASYLLFQVIYIVVPNQKISFRHSWLGAVVAAVLLEIYLALFPLYAIYFLRGFGGALVLLILLIFFYYFAMILFLGAEVNAFLAEGVRDTRDGLTTMVHLVTSHLATSEEGVKEQAAVDHKDEVPKEIHPKYDRTNRTSEKTDSTTTPADTPEHI